MRKKIRDSMMGASRALLDRLCELTTERQLSWGRANPYMPDSNSVSFKYTLQLEHADYLPVTVGHYVRLLEPNGSYVEASFRFSDEPIPLTFPEPYYRGPAADTWRLEKEVIGKAEHIFATALRKLRERHEGKLEQS
jgi:hypothetical protein